MKLADNKPFGCSEVVRIIPIHHRKVIKISAIAAERKF